MRCYEIENAVNELIPILSEAGYTEKTIDDEELLKQLCGLR